MDMDFTGQNKPEFLTSLDMQEDAVAVINAEGIILMFTPEFGNMFGYSKAELEGANISMITPQPFCSQHNSYLQRWARLAKWHTTRLAAAWIKAVHTSCKLLFKPRARLVGCRYTSTGEPHILDSVREVIGVHKERYVFPLQLCVTKLSGTGPDCVFMGVLRPVPFSARDIRVWVAAGSGLM